MASSINAFWLRFAAGRRNQKTNKRPVVLCDINVSFMPWFFSFSPRLYLSKCLSFMPHHLLYFCSLFYLTTLILSSFVNVCVLFILNSKKTMGLFRCFFLFGLGRLFGQTNIKCHCFLHSLTAMYYIVKDVCNSLFVINTKHSWKDIYVVYKIIINPLTLDTITSLSILHCFFLLFTTEASYRSLYTSV